jgi:hypothetical protein
MVSPTAARVNSLRHLGGRLKPDTPVLPDHLANVRLPGRNPRHEQPHLLCGTAHTRIKLELSSQ